MPFLLTRWTLWTLLLVLAPSLVTAQRQTSPSPSGVGRATEESLPGACVPGQHLVLVTDAGTPSQALRICDETGTGYVSLTPSGAGTGSSGLQVTQTDIRSTRHEITTLTASSTLSFQSSVCVEVGDAGVTLTLPLAATAEVGDYFLEICDTGAGSLTLEPTGSDTLNYRTDSQVVTGQGSQLIVRRMSETNWSVMSTLAGPTGGFGRLPSRLCHVTGTSAHVSSSGSGSYALHSGLTCTIPANTLQQGDLLQTCAHVSLTTGSTAPRYGFRLQAGATFLYETALPTSPVANITRALAVCWWTSILSPPGASANTQTAVIVHNPAYGSGDDTGNIIAQPVAIATNASLTWQLADQWVTAGGTGEDTARLQSFTVMRW